MWEANTLDAQLLARQRGDHSVPVESLVFQHFSDGLNGELSPSPCVVPDGLGESPPPARPDAQRPTSPSHLQHLNAVRADIDANRPALVSQQQVPHPSGILALRPEVRNCDVSRGGCHINPVHMGSGLQRHGAGVVRSAQLVEGYHHVASEAGGGNIKVVKATL
jgi:hypothetical protein